MSTDLAIEAVTRTLVQIITTGIQDLSGAVVTRKPPDTARQSGDNSDQVNLFLYHVAPNAAWRNKDMPLQVRPGETAPPALALDLDYLVTAYGAKDHELLGKSMLAMHDMPLLSPDAIRAAFPATGLDQQVERVRTTIQPLSLEDMYRLWNGFQTQYRVSAAYRIAVVLIESKRKSRSPLPVLKRGDKDQGVNALAGGSPTLTGLVLPLSQAAALLGDTIIIQGENLTTDSVTVRFSNRSLISAIELVPAPGDRDGEKKVFFPNDSAAMSAWVPGQYTLSLSVRRPNLPAWTTNELPVAIAPRITSVLGSASAGATLTVLGAPRVRDGQRALLILGDAQAQSTQVVNPANTALPSSIDFVVPKLALGSYVGRLRVDGVDSVPVIRTGTPPVPAFDPNQILQIV